MACLVELQGLPHVGVNPGDAALSVLEGDPILAVVHQGVQQFVLLSQLFLGLSAGGDVAICPQNSHRLSVVVAQESQSGLAPVGGAVLSIDLKLQCP